jgi:peptidoglycan hydrolase-like protein with peptidoglycan-binding domain
MYTVSSTPVLRRGSQGASVRDLQMLLNKRTAAGLPVDGIFGLNTESAVREFQTLSFLTVDGIVGAKTWRSLQAGTPVDMPIIARGSTGTAVRQAQTALSALNFYLGALDGIFGPQTEASVKTFQFTAGLRADGIIGPQTWNKLSEYWIGFVIH